MNAVKYIRQLLTETDCVILPDFGGFIGNYVGAHIHPITHVFSPPAKTLAFNTKLASNDGLLIEYISLEEDISKSVVSERLEELVKEIREIIGGGKEFILEGIGKLFINENKSIQFEPETDRFPLAETFGMTEFFAKPIEREDSIKLRKKQSDIMSDPRSNNPVRRPAGSANPVMRKKVPIEKRSVEKKEKKQKSGGSKAWLVIVIILVLLVGGGSTFVATNKNFSLSTWKFWEKKQSGDMTATAENATEDGTDENTGKWEEEEADAMGEDSSAASSSETDGTDGSTTEEAYASDVMIDATADSETEVESTEDNSATREIEESETVVEQTVKTSEKSWYESVIAWFKGLFGSDKNTGENYEDLTESTENGWADDKSKETEDVSNETEDATIEETETSANTSTSASSKSTKKSSEKSTKKSGSQSSTKSYPAGATISTRTNRYYVIAGAFENVDNARNYQRTLGEKGFDSKILEPRGVKNVYRVTIADFESQSEGMRKVSEENSDFGNTLWVLKY